MDIKAIITQLNTSPLFNVSLSSKELFHSNFFSWAAQAYPAEMGKLLAQQLHVPVDAITGLTRESQNLDLSFYLGKQKVVIENKVKSVPDATQLIDYKQKQPEALCVLLTMMKPVFSAEAIGWQLMDYDTYLMILEQLRSAVTNSYHHALFEDYIAFTRLLKEILQESEISRTTPFSHYLKQMRMLKKVRLHDLYAKSVMNQLGGFVLELLRTKVDPAVILQGAWSEESPAIVYYWNAEFLKGKGVFSLNRVFTGYLLGFMIDGSSLVQYIEKRNHWDGFRSFAESLEKSQSWFTALPGKKALKNGFNQFNGGTFLYQYEVIGEDATFGTLVDRMVQELTMLQQGALPMLSV